MALALVERFPAASFVQAYRVSSPYPEERYEASGLLCQPESESEGVADVEVMRYPATVLLALVAVKEETGTVNAETVAGRVKAVMEGRERLRYWYAPMSQAPVAGRAVPARSVVKIEDKFTPAPIDGEADVTFKFMFWQAVGYSDVSTKSIEEVADATKLLVSYPATCHCERDQSW